MLAYLWRVGDLGPGLNVERLTAGESSGWCRNYTASTSMTCYSIYASRNTILKRERSFAGCTPGLGPRSCGDSTPALSGKVANVGSCLRSPQKPARVQICGLV